MADRTDPLGLQRRFAAGLLGADPPTSHVYFVDDHFGAEPDQPSGRVAVTGDQRLNHRSSRNADDVTGDA